MKLPQTLSHWPDGSDGVLSANPEKSHLHGFSRSHFRTAAITSIVSLLLSACETIPPPPQVVHVSVPTPCLPSTPLLRPKVFTDAELSGMDDFKFTLAIFSDRRSLLDYSAELEAVLSACK